MLARVLCALIGHRKVVTFHDCTDTNPQGAMIAHCSRCWRYVL